jgi:hypothetical protein
VKKALLGGACVVIVAGAALMLPFGGGAASENPTGRSGAKSMSFAEISSERPKNPLRLLFIHHSVGGRILADKGPRERVDEEIWKSHPEGGGLRKLLEDAGYQVGEASYGSVIGQATDRGDWLPKFRDQMDKVLTAQLNDKPLPDGQKNHVVVWKSCFPMNMIDDDAALANAKSQLSAILPELAKHPETLFVHLTSPPLAPKVREEPGWKFLARAVLGKSQPGPRLEKAGPLARQLNDWVVSPDGWLKDYPHKNVVVFDLYDLLTDHGKSNFLAYASDGGYDSHPNGEGNQKVAAELVPFLNRAVRRAGLSE